jgi:hypothetical protein
MDRLEGKAVYTTDDERLQQVFRSLLRPEHYCYGAAGRIGRNFLRQHAVLFDERKPAGAEQRNVASTG